MSRLDIRSPRRHALPRWRFRACASGTHHSHAVLDNPFIWLCRGQVYFELGDMKQAQDILASAFMLAGQEIFETEDRKYAAFILPKMEETK